MSGLLTASALRFTPATVQERERGLLGFLRVRLGGIAIDGVAVRRTTRGKTYLAYPSRRDHAGREHPIALPVDGSDRREVEARVLAVLQPRLDELERVARLSNQRRGGRRRGWRRAPRGVRP